MNLCNVAMLPTLGACACASVGVLLLLWEQRRSRQEDDDLVDGNQNNGSKEHKSLGSSADRIPRSELQPLASLIRHVQQARGWRDSRYHFTHAWARVEARATADAGGGWEATFEPQSISNARVAALAALIDEELLGGLLHSQLLRGRWQGGHAAAASRKRKQPTKAPGSTTSKGDEVAKNGQRRMPRAGSSPEQQEQKQEEQQQQQQRQQQQEMEQLNQRRCQRLNQAAATLVPAKAQPPPPPLSYRVVDRPDGGWLAYFDESGAVFLNRWRWAKEVSRAAPVNCEGIVCTSRLQMLVHTLAHELVHAIVFYAFPELDAKSEAYLENDRHGPVFQLLNRQLFGHTSNALARCDARAVLG